MRDGRSTSLYPLRESMPAGRLDVAAPSSMLRASSPSRKKAGGRRQNGGLNTLQKQRSSPSTWARRSFSTFSCSRGEWNTATLSPPFWITDMIVSASS